MDAQERRYRSLVRRYNAMRALAMMGWFLFLVMLAWYVFSRPARQVLAIQIAGQPRAYVKDLAAAERATEQVKASLSQGLAGSVHLQPDDIKCVPTVLPEGERVSAPEEAADLIAPHVTALVEAVAIQVGGNDVAYMDTMENAKNVREAIIARFVNTATMEGEPPKVSPPMTLKATTARPEEVETDINAVADRLIGSRQESITYSVKLGDNPSSIAIAHGIDLADLKRANPDLARDMQNPDFVLVVGRELKIPQESTGVKVLWTQVVEKERAIPHETVELKTTALPPRQRRPISPGEDGRERVRLELSMKNDKEIGRRTTVLKRLKDPVNARVQVGVAPGGAGSR